MTTPCNRFLGDTPPSSSTQPKLLPLLVHLLAHIATVFSQAYEGPFSTASPDLSTTMAHVTAMSKTAKTTSTVAYRQTTYTRFSNFFATQSPMWTVSGSTSLKCGRLCTQTKSCTGFNYSRSPSKPGGPCDPKTDPKGTTCKFLAFENVSSIPFAAGTGALCRGLYANAASTDQGRMGLSPCLSYPCQNSGVCVPSINSSYGCNCRNGTTGTNCETTISAGYDCETNNPCVTTAGGEYYPAVDTTKFIQCGAGPTCYTMPCPSGLHWDQAQQGCR